MEPKDECWDKPWCLLQRHLLGLPLVQTLRDECDECFEPTSTSPGCCSVWEQWGPHPPWLHATVPLGNFRKLPRGCGCRMWFGAGITQHPLCCKSQWPVCPSICLSLLSSVGTPVGLSCATLTLAEVCPLCNGTAKPWFTRRDRSHPYTVRLKVETKKPAWGNPQYVDGLCLKDLLLLCMALALLLKLCHCCHCCAINVPPPSLLCHCHHRHTTTITTLTSQCHCHHCCATALIAMLPRSLPCHHHHHYATATIAMTLLLSPRHHHVTAIIAVPPLLSTCHHYHGHAAAIIAVPLLSLPHQSCRPLPLYTW